MASTRPSTRLEGISDIRRFFHRLDAPIFFISATNFNLLGMDEWAKSFRFISYIDCFDGRHPNTMVPTRGPHEEFESIEEINNYLLEHSEVKDYIKSMGRRPKAVFLMFDKETEKRARAIGLKVWMPSAHKRIRLDDKLETVRVGNRAGVPSVPNLLTRVKSYDDLLEKAQAANLGHDLVIQSAYGDSGHTTFFVNSRADWNKCADEVLAERKVKVMKRINCRQAAIEACTTSAGTIVGPSMTEIVGFKELTPYKGGWAGNEIFPDAFTEEIRQEIRDRTARFGEELRLVGYRGYFELDFLIDKDTDEIWLGELNPRITGASSITNHAAFAHADAPLFLFHLLEFSGVDFDLDVAALNDRWSHSDNIDSWSQVVIKHTEDSVDLLTHAPQSGIWQLNDDGSVSFARFDYHRRAVQNENEAFFLRISGPGDYRYKGADLGILVIRGRMMTKNFRLTKRAKRWIHGMRSFFHGSSPGEEQASFGTSFKML
jgi:hypothetical protein